uniref:DNA polymerase subunit gamma-1 n=1 Tax=Anopheles epiroticus TaxID=199890 RepID=A0A182PVA5_9DIPT
MRLKVQRRWYATITPTTSEILPHSTVRRVKVNAKPPSKSPPDDGPRLNEMNIQMLSIALYRQIFRSAEQNNVAATPTLVKSLRDDLLRHGIDASNPALLPDVDVKLPALRGANIEEHFRLIAEEQSEPYRTAVEQLPGTLPTPPTSWSRTAGWTRYDPVTGCATQIRFPDDSALLFDVEVCVTAGPLPVMATATGTAGCWYSWTSPLLVSDDGETDRITHYHLSQLIPLESDAPTEETLRRARVVIGHNASYDRARVREQYWLQPTALRFLDTMSLHVCVSGITSYQRAMLKSSKQLPAEDAGWSEQSSLNNLSDVYALYCGGKPLAKAKRDTFVEGSLADVRADFDSLMSYCAEDVRATGAVLQRLWPLFRERFPHPATLAGMLEMGSAYLPVNGNWTRYLTEADLAFEDLDLEAKHQLAQRADAACSLLHDAAYQRDLWLWDQDWSVQELKLKALKPGGKSKEPAKQTETPDVDENERSRLAKKFAPLYATGSRLPVRRPLLPGYPAWYRALCSKPTDPSDGWCPGPSGKLGTGMQIAPKLLSLCWEGYPLHYIRGHGWGCLVPFQYTRGEDFPDGVLPIAQLVAACPVVELKHPGATAAESTEALAQLAKNVEQTISRKDYYRKPSSSSTSRTAYTGSGVWCNVELEGCCHFLKLPHKDGASHRVGNPLSKDFLAKFSENVLAGDGRTAERVVQIARMLSYWRNNRDRIRGQLVVWDSDRDGAATSGAIIPQVVVCGTLTRRAMEPTWMTASNAQRERVGSELRAMVQAPPGYRLVGADVDSQELWIASVLGDAGTGLHGGTPFGWMTLSGTKAARTDMHSVTAQAVGISRDHAKVLNYARIYGAGQQFAERLLKQFNPTLTPAEARSKATKMFALTKGRRTYRLREQLREQYPGQPARSTAYEALGLARACNQPLVELFDGPHWYGGTESAMFNRLEEIAGSAEPATPFLGGRLSRALEPQPGTEDRFLPTRINWVVQSGAVDFLHLMLVCMRWLMGGNDGVGGCRRLRFCLSFHDEVRYLVPERYAHHAALALHVTNLLTRAFCVHRVGFRDLPQSVAFFSSVEVDRVLRKEAQHDCRTPSNPHGLRIGYSIPDGESLDVYQTLARLTPAERDIGRWDWHRTNRPDKKQPKKQKASSGKLIRFIYCRTNTLGIGEASSTTSQSCAGRAITAMLPGQRILLWTLTVAVGSIATLSGSDSSFTVLESMSYQQEDDWGGQRQNEGKLIATIFATINHIDIINGRAWPTPVILQSLLLYRTVRWFNAEPAALCQPGKGSFHSECAVREQTTDQLDWDGEQQGGYIIYGAVSEMGDYACLFDPTGTYLVMDVSNPAPLDRMEQVRQGLELIWTRRGAFRVYVHLGGTLYGYDPFRPVGTTNGYGALVQLQAGSSLPTMPPTDFAGYPVRIEVFRSVYSNPEDRAAAQITYTGPDVTARDLFCKVLNVTTNGSFTGALGRLIRREVDIVFTGFFIKDYFTREIDFTAGLYSDAVCCLVRKASRIPEALLPLYIFPGDIWALLCLLGLACACVWSVLRWCVRRLQPPAAGLWSRRHRLAVLFNLPRRLRSAGPARQTVQLYIDSFILLVSAPYLRFTRSGVERLFLTGLLLVSLVFVSLYTSGLAAVFVNPVYYPDIGTLQQLEESGMAIPVKYRGFIDDVFAVNYSRLMDSLRARMHHLQVKESMLARVARLGNIATVTRRTTLALDNAIYMTTRQLHMVPECPRTYNLAYVMPHRSVFREQFNKVLLRMVGGGLVDHWIEEARYGWTLRDWRVVQRMMESNFKVLTVLDMQFAFYVLAIGLTFSMGAIGVELVHFHRTFHQWSHQHQQPHQGKKAKATIVRK